MQTTTLTEVLKKVKTKKDGIYSFRECLYRVRDNNLWLVYDGECFLEWSFGFLCVLKREPFLYKSQAKKILKEMK